ncbi:tetratricopeptide repeat protein 7B, partial [Thecamonas trahens ATCC 50062]
RTAALQRIAKGVHKVLAAGLALAGASPDLRSLRVPPLPTAVAAAVAELAYLEAWMLLHEGMPVANWLPGFRTLLLTFHKVMSLRLHARCAGTLGLALVSRVSDADYTVVEAPAGVFAPASRKEEIALLLLLHQVVSNEPAHDDAPLEASSFNSVALEFANENPGVPELVLTFLLAGQHALVAESLELALTHAATDASLLIQYALTLEAAGEHARAALTLQRAAELEPRSPFVRVLQAKLHLNRLGDTQLGLRAVKRGLKLLAKGKAVSSDSLAALEPPAEALLKVAVHVQGALYAQAAREARDDSTRERAHLTALDTLGRAVALDPTSPGVLYSLALLHTELRNYPIAIDTIRESLRFDGSSSRGWHLLAVLLTGIKDYRGALRAIDAGLDADPDSLEMLATKADIVEHLHGGRRALPVFEEIIRVWNKLHRAGSHVLAALSDSGKDAGSLNELGNVPSLTHLAPRAHSTISRSLSIGDKKAASSMRRSPSATALSSARTSSIGYISPAMLAQLRDTVDVPSPSGSSTPVAAFGNTPTKPSPNADLTALLGSSAVLTHVSSTLSAPGGSRGRGTGAAGVASAQLSQLSLARADMLDKQLFVWCKLAALYRRLGEYESALVSLEQATSLRDVRQNSSVLYQTARILEEKGQLADAILEYERVLAIEPEHPGALLHQGIVLNAAGEADRAELPLRALLRIEPTNYKAWHQLGLVATARGLDTLAAQCFIAALELEAEHTIIPALLFPYSV